MSSIADVSAKLGDYMLKGWTLTGQTCKNPGCNGLLLHLPGDGNSSIHMCGNCDDRIGDHLSISSARTSDSASTMMSEFHHSRSSTPPTEASSTLSSPVFATPIETDESRHRREQSDRASSEIGKRLLKGWAMLGEECPNVRCYGVPLVRPPRSGDGKDPRKECVICGGAYVAEVGLDGRDRLVPVRLNTGQSNNSTVTISAPQETSESNLARNQKLAPTNMTEHVEASIPAMTSPGAFIPSQRETLLVFQPTTNMLHNAETPQKQVISPLEALEESSSALQLALRVLSTRIRHLSDPNNITDYSAIKVTADNITSVTKALSHVRQLQWSENQVRRL